MKMNKKILASVVTISIVALMVGVGTFALFSDTETSTGNTFTAGTLDLNVDGKDDPNVPFYFAESNVKPGDSGSKSVVLSNSGTLAGKAYIHFKNVVDRPGTTPEPEPTLDDGELSQNLYIKVLVGDTIKAEGYLFNIKCISYELGTIAGGGSLTVTIEWSIPSTVGEEIMGDSVTFDIEFSLVQA